MNIPPGQMPAASPGVTSHAKGLLPLPAAPQETKSGPGPEARLRNACATGPALSRRGAKTIAPQALQAVAQAIASQERQREEKRLTTECAAQLRKLGAGGPRPLAPRLVEGMADRVADVLAQGRAFDLGQLVGVLAEVLGGAAMDAASLRIVTARLLAAGPRISASNLDSGLRKLCQSLGGFGMSAAHRYAMLEGAFDTLESMCRTHGTDPTDATRRPAIWSTAMLMAMAHPSVGTVGRRAYLQAIVAQVVAPPAASGAGGPERLLARAVMLQGVSGLLTALHPRDQLPAAYVDLLRGAPAFDPALYEHAADRFLCAELLKDSPTPSRGEARIGMLGTALARWSLTQGRTAMCALMSGAASSLFNDTEFTPAQFNALVRGALDVVGPGEPAVFASLARGLLAPAAVRRHLGAEHVSGVLQVAWELTATLGGDTRRDVLVLSLGDALSTANWPPGAVTALADGLLARATTEGWAGWMAAGARLGHCLAHLLPTSRQFSGILGRMAQEPSLDAACLLVAGFFSDKDILPEDTAQFDAIAAVLAPPDARSPSRAAALAAQFALALGAHQEPAGTPGVWASCFQAGRDGKACSVHARTPPLAFGLALARDPVHAVRQAGGSASLQLERLDAACQVQGLFTSGKLEAQVRQLHADDFGDDPELRADLVLCLFQHHAALANAETVLVARHAILADRARASGKKDRESPARERLDAKGLAPARLSPREHLETQLDALYRDYVTAGAPFDPPSLHLSARLAWLYAWLASEPPGRVSDWERALVRDIRWDYAHHLPGPPALSTTPTR